MYEEASPLPHLIPITSGETLVETSESEEGSRRTSRLATPLWTAVVRCSCEAFSQSDVSVTDMQAAQFFF